MNRFKLPNLRPEDDSLEYQELVYFIRNNEHHICYIARYAITHHQTHVART